MNPFGVPLAIFGKSQDEINRIIQRAKDTRDDEFWRNPNRRNISWIVHYADRTCRSCDVCPEEAPLVKYPRTAKWHPIRRVNQEYYYCAICLMGRFNVILNPETGRYRKLTKAEHLEYDIPYAGKDARGYEWGVDEPCPK